MKMYEVLAYDRKHKIILVKIISDIIEKKYMIMIDFEYLDDNEIDFKDLFNFMSFDESYEMYRVLLNSMIAWYKMQSKERKKVNKKRKEPKEKNYQSKKEILQTIYVYVYIYSHPHF